MRLIDQLQRLYCLPQQSGHVLPPGAAITAPARRLAAANLERGPAGEAAIALHLTTPEGSARALVIEFARSAHWPQAAALYQALTEELELPAPAVAVGGPAGYQLWLSLDKPQPLAAVQAFLQALVRKYLADVPAAARRCYPDDSGEGNDCPQLPPARLANEGWSAFIDPTMGAMFADETWLPMAPNADKQADMLAALHSIKTTDFQRALARLQAESAAAMAAEPPAKPFSGQPAATAAPLAGLSPGGQFSDPRDFLLAVMNDAGASTDQRIEAAKALLPYFHIAKLAKH
ncbi:MAG TPA: hypothetical protein VFK74_06870 [Azospira sp.]|nr:hypothetical protein [Azospira sp.]